MSNAALKASCLSIGLVSAWAPTADAAIQTEIQSHPAMLGDVSHSLLLRGGGLGSGSNGGSGEMFRNAYWNGGTPDFITSELSAAELGDSFAMIGLTQLTQINELHIVVSTPGLTYLYGRSFEEAFASSNGTPGPSEQQVIGWLLNNDPAAEDFLRSHFALLSQHDGVAARCISFSQGADFGTFSVTLNSIPAPATIALAPMSLLALRRRRR